MKLVVCFVFIILSISSSAQYKDIDSSIVIFNQELIAFKPEDTIIRFDSGETQIIRLENGRMLLKNFSNILVSQNSNIYLHLSLISNGDPWDKSGSCFLIPKTSIKHFYNIETGEFSVPEPLNHLDSLSGIIAQEDYFPVIEAMRFMTPFGVGYYSAEKNNPPPLHLNKWEDSVSWRADITQLISLMQEEFYVGIWIDTWTEEGFLIDLEMQITPAYTLDDSPKKSYVLPLLNTIAYASWQSLPDIFANQDIEIAFRIPENAQNTKIFYYVTGHGGHEGGDEFTKQRNILCVDNDTVYDFFPWREDCSSFRAFNPSSGIWKEDVIVSYYDEESGDTLSDVISRIVTSSDFSRSNWCPGSMIEAELIDISSYNSGEHLFRISIPNAQEAFEKKFNHWLVSAYLYWEIYDN
jgi:hypothetical protein